ncbi:MAG: T9SS type A sorting domain-containing protein [Bacteroidetes bacterium]|nr:T9SS type A sorting domain-containing protein [Bacteroidota bacterium]
MKKIYLLLAMSLCASGIFAQFAENWNVQYQTTTAANFSNEGRRIVTDANSNVFVLGDFSSDLDSAGHNAGGTQNTVRIRKYDYLGNLIYWRCIQVGGLINNGYDNRSGFGMELDASGNLYVGYSVLNASGNMDVVINKYTNTLSLLWSYTYATSTNDIGVAFKLSASTVYAVVKTYSGANATYSIVAAKSAGTSSVPLYSFTANVDVVNDLILTSAKMIYCTGYSVVSGSRVVMTAAVNTLGALKWMSTYNHGSVTGDDYGTGLVIGSDGFIEVLGTTYTSAANGTDGLVLKYNTSGFLQGTLFLNKTTTDIGGAIVVGPAGFVFVACSNATSASVYKIQTASPISAAANATYFPTPVSAFSAVTNVSIADMKMAASNNIYLCGTVSANAGGGNFTASFLGKFGYLGFNFRLLNNIDVNGVFADNYSSVGLILDGYKNDIIYLRNNWGNNTNHASEKIDISDLDGGASLRQMQESTLSENSIPEFTVYPNPASEMITVAAPVEINSIEISDLTGKIVRTVKVNSVEAQILVSDLNKGLYVCKSTSVDGSVAIKRLVIN